MQNLYEQVYNRNGGERATNLQRAYSDVYNESETADNPDKPNVTVFYAYDTDSYGELIKLADQNRYDVKTNTGIKTASMDVEYFQKRVEGRLDEAMYRTTVDITRIIFTGTQDKVALRGIYDILAQNRVTNSVTQAILEYKKDGNGEDNFINRVDSIPEYDVINVIDLLASNYQYIISSEAVNDDQTTEVTSLINELWNVKEVEGRTSVGRGELAMCMLSTAVKGAPGDVVRVREKSDDPLTDRATNTKVSSISRDVKLEVKGFGGRPGLGKYADKFAKNAIDVLKKSNLTGVAIESEEAKQELNTLITQKIGVTYDAQLATIKQFFESLGEHINTISPEAHFSATYNQSWSTFDQILTQYADPSHPVVDQEQYAAARNIFLADVEQIAEPTAANIILIPTADQTWREAFSIVGDYENKPNTRVAYGKILTMLGDNRPGFTKQGKTSTSLPKIVNLQQKLLASPHESITASTSFKDAVEDLFLHVLPKTNASTTILASVLSQARPEELDSNINSMLVEAIVALLDGEELNTADPDQLSRAVGAVQLASYCSADKFSHAMLVDDRSTSDAAAKPALVIRTDEKNIKSTFTRIYRAFMNARIKVPLSIDAQNKGVQLQYMAS